MRKAMWKFIFLVFLGLMAGTVKGELELGDDCEGHDDCEDIANAICNSYEVCECREGYLGSSDKSKCLPMAVKIGDKCEVQDQCEDIPDAECKNNSCVVPQDMSDLLDSKKNGSNVLIGHKTFSAVQKPLVLAKPSQECIKDSDCSTLLIKQICKNGTCIVEIPSVSPKSILTSIVPDVFILGKPCANDTDCSGEGSACTDKQCKCKEDFVSAQNLKSCLLKAKSVGDKCSETSQCISLDGSICEDGKCAQKIPKMLTIPAENLPNIKVTIGSTCQNDKECQHLTNSLCVENVCQCKDNYVTSLTSSSCLEKAKKEGDACEIDKQCEDISGATCVQKKCVKPAVVGRKLGKSNSGSTTAISQLLAAILFYKWFLL